MKSAACLSQNPLAMRFDFVIHGIRRQVQLTRSRNSAGFHANPAKENWIRQDLENTGQVSRFEFDSAVHPVSKADV